MWGWSSVAEPEGVHVHGLHADRRRAGDVVEGAVAHVQDPLGGQPEPVDGRLEHARVGLADAHADRSR